MRPTSMRAREHVELALRPLRTGRLMGPVQGLVLVLLVVGAPQAMASSRDPLQQPFRSSSIWNLPLGSHAAYEPSRNSRSDPDPGRHRYGYGIGDDHDIIILTPDEPLTEVRQNTVGWGCHSAHWNSTAGRVVYNCSGAHSRCDTEGAVLFKVPIPREFVVAADGGNNGMAALMPDRRTVVQGQPFARCAAGAPATAEGGCLDGQGRCKVCKNPMGRNETTCIGYGLVANVDLYGDGILGAHGGSGLSCLGGSIRKGEFMPGSGHVRHTLKVEVRLAFCSPGVPDCRWPAKYWPGCTTGQTNCTSRYATSLGTKEGSLLAIPPTIGAALESQLKTELARRMLWTLTHFGAYVVDCGAGSFAMAFEAGPNVSMHPETFGSAAAQLARAYNLSDDSRPPPNYPWGPYALRVDDPGSEWSKDVDALERALHLVSSWDNETYARVAASGGKEGAGGGPPLEPWAPELQPPQ
jgi:hypothetical protein